MKGGLLGLAALAAAAAADGRSAGAAPLQQTLERLAADHGFELSGASRLEGEAPADGGGGLGRRLATLLAGYNHILVRKGDGAVARVVIVSPKRHVAPPPPRGTIATLRQGRHHVVEAALRGPGGAPVTARLMVDTGASTVVLPLSMLAALGFAPDALRATSVRTANRTVRARMGVLKSVDVGGMTASDVRVAFIDDDRLAGTKLLGMSFLRRFRVTIDDAANRITLVRGR